LIFPEKTKVFPAPLGLVTSAQRVPAQTKKKEKIGTIFCPKGGLALWHRVRCNINILLAIFYSLRVRRKILAIYWKFHDEVSVDIGNFCQQRSFANISTALCAKGQGLPLGRKLSQFFLFFCLGRDVLIMTF
jgi:hypothetical protein